MTIQDCINNYGNNDTQLVGAKSTVYGSMHLTRTYPIILVSPTQIIIANSNNVQIIRPEDLTSIKVKVLLLAADIKLVFPDQSKIMINIAKIGGKSQKEAIDMFCLLQK